MLLLVISLVILLKHILGLFYLACMLPLSVSSSYCDIEGLQYFKFQTIWPILVTVHFLCSLQFKRFCLGWANSRSSRESLNFLAMVAFLSIYVFHHYPFLWDSLGLGTPYFTKYILVSHWLYYITRVFDPPPLIKIKQ